MKKLKGKILCMHYEKCGSSENCRGCLGFKKEKNEEKIMERLKNGKISR